MPSLKTPSHPQREKPNEEEANASYTHGFEKIYAIETLDTSTIRPMKKASEVPKTSPISPPQSSKAPVKRLAPQKEIRLDSFQAPSALKQLPLDFGGSFPFFLSPSQWSEPLESLGLSPFLKRVFKEKKLHTLKDLLDNKGNIQSELRSHLGQGHVDELENALKQRFPDPSCMYSQQIDTNSWLRYLILDVDPQGSYLLLKDYQLQEVVTLNSEQKVGVKHLFEDQKSEKIQQAKELLKSEGKKQWLEEKFQEVARVYLLPWGRQKGGLLKGYEIYQRYLSLALSRESAAHCWRFFKDFYFHKQTPFEKFLYPLSSSHLYATHPHQVKEFELFNRLIDSYFYNEAVCYESQQLEGHLLQECAQYWVSFPKGFIQRALLFSSRLQKNWGQDGKLRLKLKSSSRP